MMTYVEVVESSVPVALAAGALSSSLGTDIVAEADEGLEL